MSTLSTVPASDFLQILDSIPDGIYVVDGTGKTTFVNRAAAAMVGYQPHELMGIPPHDVIRHTREDGSACAAADCPILTAAAAGLECRRDTDLFWRRDGTSFPVAYEGYPLGREGGGTGFILSFRDVTARQRTQSSLVEENRLSALTADVGLAVTGSDSLPTILQACVEAVVKHLDAAFARVWTLNPEEQMLELQASAGLYTHLDGAHGRVPVGQFKIGLIAAERRPHLTNAVIGDPRVGDQAWAAREGMRAFAGYPLMVGDALVGVLAMFSRHELTAASLKSLATVANGVAIGIRRKRTEDALRGRADDLARLAEALERTNKELDAFAYAASHDLRAPLRGIANLAQWIEEDLTAAGQLRAETREMLELIRSRMHRMEALIDGILQYSRVGRDSHDTTLVDSATLVKEVADLLSVPAAALAVGNLPTFETAPLPLQQIFMNLIGNALKHNHRPDPVIRIDATEAGQWYQFRVADNGPGIAPEYHDRIWGIFQTLEARDRVEGTGIGLSLVKKLVEAEGGRAWVDSEPGHGATFSFTWPKNRS